jgi:hypothetical protein
MKDVKRPEKNTLVVSGNTSSITRSLNRTIPFTSINDRPSRAFVGVQISSSDWTDWTK